MDSLLRDLRYGFRRVIASPGFTATAILTLALGIGTNVAIFTVVNAVLIRPLPFPDPDRLVRIAADARATNGRNIGISQPELDDLRDRAGIFEGVTALWPVSASFVGGERPERIEVMVTSANYFQLLGAAPQLGRVYGPADAVPGFSDAVVISDGLWRRAFGGAPDAIGRKVVMDTDTYTIVGVMPRDFRHPGETVRGDVDMWSACGFAAAPFVEPAAAAAELHSRRDGTSQARHLAAAGTGSPRGAGRRSAVGLSGQLSGERAVGAAARRRAERADQPRQAAARCADGSRRTAARHRLRQHREPHAGAGVEPRARDRGAARAGRDARAARAPAARREPRRRRRRRRRRAGRVGVVEGLDRRDAAGRSAAAPRGAIRRRHDRDRPGAVDDGGRRVRHRAGGAGLGRQPRRQPERRRPRRRRGTPGAALPRRARRSGNRDLARAPGRRRPAGAQLLEHAAGQSRSRSGAPGVRADLDSRPERSIEEPVWNAGAAQCLRQRGRQPGRRAARRRVRRDERQQPDAVQRIGSDAALYLRRRIDRGRGCPARAVSGREPGSTSPR